MKFVIILNYCSFLVLPANTKHLFSALVLITDFIKQRMGFVITTLQYKVFKSNVEFIVPTTTILHLTAPVSAAKEEGDACACGAGWRTKSFRKGYKGS